MLAPHDVCEFFDRYWERETLHLRGSLSRFPFEFTRADYFSALRGCDVVKASFVTDSGEHRDVRIDPERAQEGFEHGYSICVSQVERGSESIQTYLRDLEASLRHVGNFTVNGYLSPGDKGFGLHFDNHSVWVLQLEGTKHWSYSAGPAVPFPLSNKVLPAADVSIELPWYRVERPDESQLFEATLEPGDVLYLPAGVWHKTRASGYSLSLTLAQWMTSAGDFAADFLRYLLLCSEEGRRYLPAIPIARGGTEAARDEVLSIFEQCLALMRQSLDQCTPEELYRDWRTRIAARRSAGPPSKQQTTERVPWER